MTNDEVMGNPLEFDFVDQMHWEDLVEFETLESAELEDSFIADSVPAAQKEYYNDENSCQGYYLSHRYNASAFNGLGFYNIISI